MSKFSGVIGFAISTEVRPSVWDDIILEKKYKGDLIRLGSRWQVTENRNDDLVIANRISIIMDPWAQEHFYQIKFVIFHNAAFKVTNIEVEYPRLILELGGVYNGPRANS